ncbi:hypothetical protein TB2_007367 [Malus domestica]
MEAVNTILAIRVGVCHVALASARTQIHPAVKVLSCSSFFFPLSHLLLSPTFHICFSDGPELEPKAHFLVVFHGICCYLHVSKQSLIEAGKTIYEGNLRPRRRFSPD